LHRPEPVHSTYNSFDTFVVDAVTAGDAHSSFVPARTLLRESGGSEATRNGLRTARRRNERDRRGVADLAFAGLGWVVAAPLEVAGMWGWGRTVQYGALSVAVSDGVRVHVRPPLPATVAAAAGSSPEDWSE